MALTITHPFVNTQGDGPDPLDTQPSHWNQSHNLNLIGPSIPGRAGSGLGVATEIAIGDSISIAGNRLSVNHSGFAQPLKVAFAGDSIAFAMESRNKDSAFAFAAMELYPVEYEVVLNTAVGGTSSSHLISAQIATLEALPTKPDIVVVQTIQNDYIGSVANADTYYAYLVEYSQRALASGVKMVVLCSRPPKTSVPDVAAALYYLNRKIEGYCRDTPGNFYWDTFSAWREKALLDTSGVPWKLASGGLDAYSVDGTHPVGLANRNAAPGIVPVLQRFAKPLLLNAGIGLVYDNVNYPYTNVLGPDGMMLGTNGQLNGVNNTGVAGSAADPYERWNITASAGLSVTPSIVTKEDGYRYQQMVISGTASADTEIVLNRPFVFDVSAGTFVSEGIVHTIALTGVRGIIFDCLQSLDFTSTSDIGVGTTKFTFRSGRQTLSNSGFSNRNNGIRIPVASGKTVSGTIQVGRFGLFRVF